jgi:hypothetical protein
MGMTYASSVNKILLFEDASSVPKAGKTIAILNHRSRDK